MDPRDLLGKKKYYDTLVFLLYALIVLKPALAVGGIPSSSWGESPSSSLEESLEESPSSSWGESLVSWVQPLVSGLVSGLVRVLWFVLPIGLKLLLSIAIHVHASIRHSPCNEDSVRVS